MGVRGRINTVIKRDGREVPFDKQRIINAICAAMDRTENKNGTELAEHIANRIAIIEDTLSVEQIQDHVERALMNSDRKDVAKEYIGYRRWRTGKRQEQSNIQRQLQGLVDLSDPVLIDSNANKDVKVIPTQRDIIAGIVCRENALQYIYSPKVVDAHNEGILYLHDLDYSPLQSSYNCMLIHLRYMLENGFKLGNAEIETPKSFASACAITAQIIAQVASCIYGGNTINGIDEILAPYAVLSFKKYFKKHCDRLELDITVKDEMIFPGNKGLGSRYKLPYQWAMEDTLKEIKDGCQSLEYEINTLHTANGRLAA